MIRASAIAMSGSVLRHAWSCPQCGRSVPAREEVCHCGCVRPAAGAAAGIPGAAKAPAAEVHPWRELVLGPLLLPLVVLVLGFVFARSRPSPVAASNVAGQPSSARAPGPRYPALPLAPAADEAEKAPSTGDEPARENLSDTLIRIGEEADGLETDYETYREACLGSAAADAVIIGASGASAAGPDAAGADGEAVVDAAPVQRNWFALWREPATAWAPPDCTARRGELVDRADRLGAALDALETLARDRGLDAELVPRLLVEGRLSGWREVWERHRAAVAMAPPP